MPAEKAATRAKIQQLYPTGRFSGGTNYIDTLSQLLAAPVENFAIGGARATFRHTEANAPLRANATLETIGGTAVYLASDYGACTTGEVLRVDGGFHVLGMPQQDNL